jgi:hypothetical protein
LILVISSPVQEKHFKAWKVSAFTCLRGLPRIVFSNYYHFELSNMKVTSSI